VTGGVDGAPIRVLVVEDSAFMRGVLRHILSSDPGIEVVGVATDGLQAVQAVERLAPQVVTMDVHRLLDDPAAYRERVCHAS
jgi:two-component system chemotaxis response regulator CheB